MNLGTRLYTFFNGREVGTDQAGNRYFESKKLLAGKRRRWVWFSGAIEATNVPPEWHGWLHYTTDAPLEEGNHRAWQKPHLPNVTGTAASYRPPGHDYAGGHRAAASSDYQAWTPEG